MKNYKNYILCAGVIILSVLFYLIFTTPFDKSDQEVAMACLIVKSLFAMFDMGVAVALFKESR